MIDNVGGGLVFGRSPEIIEVEPIVWGQPAIVLESFSVALDQLVQLNVALRTRQRDALGKWLAVEVVVVGLAVETKS